MKLVKLPDGNFVNPSFVTCIKAVPQRYQDGTFRQQTEVWCLGDAGYHTTRFTFEGDVREQLAGLVHKAEGEK